MAGPPLPQPVEEPRDLSEVSLLQLRDHEQELSARPTEPVMFLLVLLLGLDISSRCQKKIKILPERKAVRARPQILYQIKGATASRAEAFYSPAGNSG